MKRPNESAVLHLLKGTLEALEIDVPPGEPHQLGNLEVTFTTPSFAMVVRELGTAGDGYNKGKQPEAPGVPIVQVTLAAVLLYLSKCEISGGAKARARWEEAIRESLEMTEVPLPIEAAAALKVVQAEQVAPPFAPTEPGKTKTPAKRTGAKEVTFTIKRVKGAA